MKILFAPDYKNAHVIPSPNFGPRRGVDVPDLVILHYTGMKDATSAQLRLCDASAQVSSHYLIDEDGQIIQMVQEKMRAWHAGVSCWHGETDINSHSIGIEIVNCGHAAQLPEFPKSQIQSVIDLCRDISRRYQLGCERFVGHSDIAPGRKLDPGENFPWHRLAKAGIGCYVEPRDVVITPVFGEGDCGPHILTLQQQLRALGYNIDLDSNFTARMKIVVEAFQRHFRPQRVDGQMDGQSRDALHRLFQNQANSDKI